MRLWKTDLVGPDLFLLLKIKPIIYREKEQEANCGYRTKAEASERL